MYHKVISNLQELVEWLKNTTSSLDWKRQYLVTIKVFRKKRSISQSNTYWMWMTALSNHIGDTKEDVHNDLIDALGDLTKETMHEAFKRKYLPWNEIRLPGGLSYYAPGHTPEQDTKEFSEYMNKIHVHAMQFFGMFLPYPDDESFPEFMETYNVVI